MSHIIYNVISTTDGAPDYVIFSSPFTSSVVYLRYGNVWIRKFVGKRCVPEHDVKVQIGYRLDNKGSTPCGDSISASSLLFCANHPWAPSFLYNSCSPQPLSTICSSHRVEMAIMLHTVPGTETSVPLLHSPLLLQSVVPNNRGNFPPYHLSTYWQKYV
jgi:hypothetical protein